MVQIPRIVQENYKTILHENGNATYNLILCNFAGLKDLKPKCDFINICAWTRRKELFFLTVMHTFVTICGYNITFLCKHFYHIGMYIFTFLFHLYLLNLPTYLPNYRKINHHSIIKCARNSGRVHVKKP